MGMKEKADIAFHRSRVYRLLSYCFLYPTEELSGFLRNGDFAKEIGKALDVYPLKAELSEPNDIKGLTDVGIDEITDEHIRLLTLKSKCPPYEAEYYRSAASVFSSEEMADIAGFYRAFGMGFSGDRPDHIAAELEFMHLATMKEAEAAFKGDTEKAELCIYAEKKFLNDHLGRWVDVFSEALLSEGSSFYYSISMCLKQWISMECQYFNISPQRVIDFKIKNIEEENQICMGGSHERI
jgi:TorA maturation chaperone TorD